VLKVSDCIGAKLNTTIKAYPLRANKQLQSNAFQRNTIFEWDNDGLFNAEKRRTLVPISAKSGGILLGTHSFKQTGGTLIDSRRNTIRKSVLGEGLNHIVISRLVGVGEGGSRSRKRTVDLELHFDCAERASQSIIVD
jgi:hypothetical protein